MKARPGGLGKADLFLALAMGLLVAGLAMLLRTPWHSWGDDFAGYMLQARSLESGQMQAEVMLNRSLMTASDSFPVPAAYSWGFPALLWMGSRVGGWELLALKVIGGLSLGIAAAFTFLLGRSYLSRSSSVLASALVGLQPTLLQSADLLLSDLPFLALAAAALFVMDRSVRIVAAEGDLSPGGPVLAALLTVASYTVRANAVALGGAFMLMLGYLWFTHPARRSALRRAAVLYAGTCAALLALYVAWSPGDSIGAYASLSVMTPRSIGRTAVQTALLVPSFLPFKVLPNGWPVLTLVALAAAAWLIILGVRQARPFVIGLVLFAVLDIGLLLVMPFAQGARFLYPLLIPAAILALCGGHALWGADGQPAGRRPPVVRAAMAATPGLVAVMVALMAVQGYREGRRPRSYRLDGPYAATTLDLGRAIVAQVPADERVAFYRPRALRLLTGRPALAISTVEHADRASWFALSKPQTPDSRELISRYQIGLAYFTQHAEEFERRYENSQFVLFHRSGPPSAGVRQELPAGHQAAGGPSRMSSGAAPDSSRSASTARQRQ